MSFEAISNPSEIYAAFSEKPIPATPKAELRKMARIWRATAAENMRVGKEERKRFGKFAASLEAYGSAMQRCARELERIAR